MEILSTTQCENDRADWPLQMQRALELAARVINTSPNPRVGCVLSRAGEIVGEGWHEAPGLAHAEVMALTQAGDRARGALAFVTLEPCAHHGRTGPCSDALIAAGVSQVIIAGLDPNPNVSGQGVAALEAAGVAVTHLQDFEFAARQLNPGYFKRREQGLPRLILKMAMSLDGRTAMADGEAKWITCPEARADVQRLRLSSSAILTGINTVLLDDPSLNVRPENLDLDSNEKQWNARLLGEQPLRVILDSQLRTPGTAKILGVEGECIIYTAVSGRDGKAHIGKAGIKSVKSADGRVDLRSVLESLAADHECNDVLVEAGPILSGAFVRSGLVDEVVLYMAPKLLGSDAKPLVEISGLASLQDSIDFEVQDLRQVGADVRLVLKPV